MMRRTFFCALGLLMLAAVGFAGSMKRPQKQRVYMFGFAASFVDSVAYMTDLQGVDAYLMPNGYLADRSLYALQFNNHVVSKEGKEIITSAVFYDKKKSKLEKKYQKVRKKYRENHAVILQSVGVDQFRFEPEEYMESEIIDSVVNAVQTASKTQASPKKSSKKKK